MPSVRGPYTPDTRIAASSRSPSSFQPSAAISSGAVTSSANVSAPSSLSASSAAPSRAVASTRQPLFLYCRTNSWPKPRDATTINTVFIVILEVFADVSDQFDTHCGRLAAADTQRRDAALQTALSERADQRDEN